MPERRAASRTWLRLVTLSRYRSPDAEVQRAGGTFYDRGEFAPGYSFVYVVDPDGYEIEICYE